MSKFIEVIDSDGKPIAINKELITDIRPSDNNSCYIRLSGSHEIKINKPYHIVNSEILGFNSSEYEAPKTDPNVTKDDLGIF
ncbi:hypothetical protein [Dysgonomonas capnocytophagoides]|uniref:hypothetical protein n=1 Tax=Dysgonomonas capnocytophagoides TaxID=45254 RepID=UPI00333E2E0D